MEVATIGPASTSTASETLWLEVIRPLSCAYFARDNLEEQLRGKHLQRMIDQRLLLRGVCS
jgi:hypothetical protein